MLRKATLVLALIGASVLFLGAAPSTAGASNCSSNLTPTVWQADGNYLRFYGYEQSCSDVDLIELDRDICLLYGICGANTATGWYDYSIGQSLVAPRAYNIDMQICGRQYTTFTGTCGWTWYYHPWCSGNTHTVHTSFIFRLHSKSQQSWGPFHYANSANYAIVC